MSNRSKLGSIGSLLLVALVSSGVVVSSAGVAQASPVSLGEGVHSPSKVSTVTVPGTNIVVSGAGAWSASITLPGTASSEALAKPGKIPDGLFAGQGEPVLSTKLNSAVISSYATGKGTQTLMVPLLFAPLRVRLLGVTGLHGLTMRSAGLFRRGSPSTERVSCSRSILIRTQPFR